MVIGPCCTCIRIDVEPIHNEEVSKTIRTVNDRSVSSYLLFSELQLRMLNDAWRHTRCTSPGIGVRTQSMTGTLLLTSSRRHDAIYARCVCRPYGCCNWVNDGSACWTHVTLELMQTWRYSARRADSEATTTALCGPLAGDWTYQLMSGECVNTYCSDVQFADALNFAVGRSVAS